ncbi:MAG: hypothetical protein O3C45_09505 [Bacteroidetes bacterium]|nr:hypothetical protein [Bacteroidota bacterium]
MLAMSFTYSTPMNRFSLLLCTALVLTNVACAQSVSDTDLINQALAAAPEDLAADARVLSYNNQGLYRVVREGSNGLTCVADNPEQDAFEVVCFHSELEPYMARGRELRAEGMSGAESVAKRGEEIQAGTLAFTEGPSTLYIRYGEEAYYDQASGQVMNSMLRYVIYTPYATSATTGLPEKAAGPGAPWLMLPGNWQAHIMITPPAPAPADSSN